MLRVLDGAAGKLRSPRVSPRDASVERDYGLAGAQRILEDGWRDLGLKTEQLPDLKKGDVRKAALAVRLRTMTAVSNAWIAGQLHLGHVSRVNQCARKPPRRTC